MYLVIFMRLLSSLNHLMQVVASLSQGGKGSSISYRECRLTRLLQDSFGGNSFLALVTHISPAGIV